MFHIVDIEYIRKRLLVVSDFRKKEFDAKPELSRVLNIPNTSNDAFLLYESAEPVSDMKSEDGVYNVADSVIEFLIKRLDRSFPKKGERIYLHIPKGPWGEWMNETLTKDVHVLVLSRALVIDVECPADAALIKMRFYEALGDAVD